jgi:hypothetical protein
MEARSTRGVLVLYLACIALATFYTSRGVDAQEDRPYLPREDCITNGEALLGDVGFLLENQDAVSCASGAGVACCRALDSYFGPNSTFWGCPCYEDLFEEALTNLPSFARPLVQQRMVECGIPTPNAGCKATSTNVTSNAQDEIFEPELGQSGTMQQYSAPWSYATKGYDAYGEWFPCMGVEDAKYCVSLVTYPGVYSETKWGVCVPDTMNDTSINEAITNSNPGHYTANPPKTYCDLLPKTLPDWNAGAITVTAILLLLGLITVVATLVGYLKRNVFPSGAQRGSAYVERAQGVYAEPSRASTLFYGLVDCFDLQPNWKVLVAEPKVEKEDDTIESDLSGLTLDLRSLNGMRALSMFWIILGHTGSTIFFNFNLSYFSYWAFNPENYKWLKDWYFPMYAGLFGVDSFLFISGLLVAYKFSQQMSKRSEKKKCWVKELKFWFLYCFARWLRLLPVLVVVMFTTWKLVGQLTTSPSWNLFWNASYVEPCNKYWWATLLFIQNIYPSGESFGNKGDFCVPVSWYLAVDMQLYMFVAPLVLITYHYGLYSSLLSKCRKGLATAFIFALLALSVALTVWIVVTKQVMWQFLGVGDFDRYYIKPWTRAPPYLFGLLLGLALFELKQKKNERLYRFFALMKSWLLCAVWLVAFGVLLLLAFTPSFYLESPKNMLPPLAETTGAGMTPPETYAYMSLRYFGWGLCLLVIFGVNCIGRGWLVNDLLAGYVFAPLAKLTYCAYLITIVLQDVVTQSLINHPVYYNTWTMLSYWCTFVCGGYAISLVCYMCVEAPFGNMLRLLMKLMMPNPQRRSIEPASSEETIDLAHKEAIFSPREGVDHSKNVCQEEEEEEETGGTSNEIEMLRKVTASYLNATESRADHSFSEEPESQKK